MALAKAYVLGEPFQSIKAAGRMADAINRLMSAKDAEIERLQDVVAALQAQLEGGELASLEDLKAEMSVGSDSDG